MPINVSVSSKNTSFKISGFSLTNDRSLRHKTEAPDTKQNVNHRVIFPCFLLSNIRSIRYKIDELQCIILQNNVNICCITESWLDESIPTKTIDIAGFNCFRKDRCSNQKGGGVACYVDADWPCEPIEAFNVPDLETLWVSIRRPTMPRFLSHIIMCVVYHPPASNNQQMIEHIIECIDKITQQHPYAGIVVLGDVNQLNDRQLISYPLRQLVKKPTRKHAILDKIYSNIEYYNMTTILPNVGSSDHNAILLKPEQYKCPHQSKYVEVTVRSNNRNGRNLFANALHYYDWNILETFESVNDKLDCFNNVVLSLLDYYLPTYTVKRHTNDKPWITDEFRKLIRQRQYAFRHGKTEQYKRLRNDVNRKAKKLREKYYHDKIQQLKSSDSRNWWRQIKRLTGQGINSDLQNLANIHTDGNFSTLAQNINQSLQNVAADLSPLSPNFCEMSEYDTDDKELAYVRTIHPIEVFYKLSRINIHKSIGPDGIPNWVLRDMAFAVAEPICHIFNASITQSVMPTAWKKANVITIPKTNPPTNINTDLRPISLTPTLSKILESFVGGWMLEKISCQFDINQYGAIKGRSTTHELVHYLHICHHAIESHKVVRTLFVDYSKAFDHVDHGIVLHKMMKLKVQPYIIKWMHSFLYNRQQRVKINQFTSEWVTLNGGVPQGSWLGPYLFLIHINDLTSANTLLKFIDDITETEIVERSAPSQLQLSVDSIGDWSEENHMNINVKKTKEMIMDMSVKNNSKLLFTDLRTKTGVIERVSSFKLLGITIDDNLKWNSHVNNICSKASQRLFFLKLLRRSGVPKNDLLQFYKTIIRPVIEYACPVWQSGLTEYQKQQIESVQKRAFRIISGTIDYDYYCACSLFDVELLTSRLETIAKSFYIKISNSNDCIHHLLPPETERPLKLLRHSKPMKYMCRTDRFGKSFIPYAVNNFT